MASQDENQPQSAIKLHDNFAYQFENDLARLSADVVLTSSDHGAAARCALQLWACNTPFNGESLNGTKVAEIDFSPQVSTSTSVQGVVPAHFPVGKNDFVMVMALLSETDEGNQKIVDFINFDRKQQFLQPSLGSDIRVAIENNTAHIYVGRINNPREANNISGTLSLEVWAGYDAAQTTENNGRWLGGVNLGQLAGGESWYETQVEIPLGTFSNSENVVLLLQEWTVNGFATRDFYQAIAAKPEAKTVAAKTVAAKTVAAKTVAAKTVEAKAQVVIEAAAKVAEAKPASVKAKAAEKAPKLEAKKEKSVLETVKAESSLVSINTASLDELAAVKGISPSVATKIVENRPYKNVQELSRVRGIAARTLEKLRSLLSV